jgi:hypothetical protein
MQQFRHMIRPNASTRAPSQFICVQAITDKRPLHGLGKGWRHSFAAVVAVRFRIEQGKVTREQWIHHAERADFWEWFYSQPSPTRATWVWCNDLVFHASILDLWGELDRKRMAHRTACLTAKVAYISVQKGETRAVWVDSRNWFEKPAKELDKAVRTLANGRFHLAPPHTEAMLDAEQEVMVLQHEVCQLVSFIRQNDLGVLRLTRAGQAMQAYRHRFGPREWQLYTPRKGKNKGRQMSRQLVLPIIHNSEATLDLESAGLFGGATHCFYVGKVDTPVYHLDTNALYPAVMQSGLYPSRLVCHMTDVQLPTPLELMHPETCIARVHLKTDRPIYPLRRPGLTIYPTGSFSTILCGQELKRAIECCHVDRISEFARYELAPLFRDFVDNLWALRKQYESQNNSSWSQLVKTIMNSLHGKFSQRANAWKETPEVMPAMHWGFWPEVLVDKKQILQRRAIAGKTQTHISEGWAPCAFPAISAFVYSNARLHMRQFFNSIKEGRVYYSAIDSIHCDRRGRDELTAAGHVIPEELGKLRTKEIATSALYNGPGDYQFGTERKQSGIPLNGERLKDGSIEWPENEHIQQLISRKPDGEVVTRFTKVHPTRVYRHGSVQSDGWVKPFHLEE